MCRFQGAHVTINARAEEDVEPEVIIEKVAKASGANYSFHKESKRFQDSGPQGPVVGVQRVQKAVCRRFETNDSRSLKGPRCRSPRGACLKLFVYDMLQPRLHCD